MYSGAVLAGGASGRFGEDKALFVYRGKPLLLWVLESLRGAEERFIVANRPYVGFGVPVYPDLLPGADSLSGLHSALAHARFPWVAVAATDLPFLTRGFWDFLYEQARASPYPVVAVYSPEGHLEPLMALYHKDCLPQVERQIREGTSAWGGWWRLWGPRMWPPRRWWPGLGSGSTSTPTAGPTSRRRGILLRGRMLRLENITKRFGPVVANDRIGLRVRAGRSSPSWGRTGRGRPPW